MPSTTVVRICWIREQMSLECYRERKTYHAGTPTDIAVAVVAAGDDATSPVCLSATHTVMSRARSIVHMHGSGRADQRGSGRNGEREVLQRYHLDFEFSRLNGSDEDYCSLDVLFCGLTSDYLYFCSVACAMRWIFTLFSLFKDRHLG